MKHLIFLVYFGFGGLLYGQGVTDEFVESLFDSGHKDWYCLMNVITLNYHLQSAGNFDTIAYRRKRARIVFSYRGSPVKELCDRGNTETRVSVYDGGLRFITRSCHGIFREPNKVEMRINVYNKHYFPFEKEVVIAYYRDNVFTGRYLELTLDNIMLTEGVYQQIDSSYVDTIPTLKGYLSSIVGDDNIYVPRKKYPKKIGTWVYYNPSGDTLKVEHYPEKYD